jgi:hypothetical protein
VVIDADDAQRLRRAMERAGLRWEPQAGDRFWVPDRDLDDSVFVVAEMTIDVVEATGGPLIRFNGTVEWALDSIAAADVVWLPWEHQLRVMLADQFATLEALGGIAGGYAVALSDGSRHVHVDPEQAYLAAALAWLESGDEGQR